jgi:hypothetical protein
MKPIAKAKLSNFSISTLLAGFALVPAAQHEPCQVTGATEIRHFRSFAPAETHGPPSGGGHWHGW